MQGDVGRRLRAWRARAGRERLASVALAGALVTMLVVGILHRDEAWTLAEGWGVDPRLYLALGLVPLPLCWWAAFAAKRAAFAADVAGLCAWAIVNRCLAALPLAYAAVVGSGLPWFARPLVGLYGLLAAGTVVWRVRRTRTAAGRASTAPGAVPAGSDGLEVATPG
ncbi:hypothetical protein PO878_20330 [Iamia majanohamensis]|uniref:Uncharacterized protein n=1 Tax=Iamia majanohamensis TaxID=467976 RepID=A0AAE9YDK4_9ACTN|nr:hypothetical protein [Iamia majanohamensis]WCO66842.1 hypothetical protein PO878_20330 [Iamia majanohamensis]